MADVTTLVISDDQTDLLIEDDSQTIVAENEPEHINSVDIRTVILLQNETAVISVVDAQTVVIQGESTTVIGSTDAGPQGPAGPPGGSVPEDLLFTYDVDDRLTDVDGETKYLVLVYNVDGLLETVTDTVSGVVKTLAYDVDNKLISLTVS